METSKNHQSTFTYPRSRRITSSFFDSLTCLRGRLDGTYASLLCTQRPQNQDEGVDERHVYPVFWVSSLRQITLYLALSTCGGRKCQYNDDKPSMEPLGSPMAGIAENIALWTFLTLCIVRGALYACASLISRPATSISTAQLKARVSNHMLRSPQCNQHWDGLGYVRREIAVTIKPHLWSSQLLISVSLLRCGCCTGKKRPLRNIRHCIERTKRLSCPSTERKVTYSY
ncbi:uncharacterized protein LY89DRAFT_262960 [Mollisia scopiformis]|uniref:Uncharacterized protein n=1 Tax=Mollisia scopiformis TaxID=149040 RepID=A0A132BFL5_MOLSC|nr:uncharacterized protein LY89DRAFT_262960 [Mollisia scopiformis]KUJ10507.1 hypothetical protein LY89DRAFT_262960 [Mollisia scopiformis]